MTKPKKEKPMLPYWFYMAGSICFAIGTGIVMIRHYFGG